MAAPATMHKATPADLDRQTCGVCGQRIKRVMGGHGFTYVHSDSRSVLGHNPPEASTLSDRVARALAAPEAAVGVFVEMLHCSEAEAKGLIAALLHHDPPIYLCHDYEMKDT